ncbi:DUF6516 family protein [uncultured Azohydromonas sp.]|uniref:toxin-antitoxin system TumE family protein n=1 Tax=uncultured Azohydromonas sp. TaxID=487342 RepID=UPI00263512A4|nr:DUF6516 family protein [uncultured Azohydromonas sp.]
MKKACDGFAGAHRGQRGELVRTGCERCSQHTFKYRLYFGAAGVCRVRYDNERGKGDHRHICEREDVYCFTTVEQLLADFESDVRQWRPS